MFDQLLKFAEENLSGISNQIPDVKNIENSKLNNVTSQVVINTIMQQLKGGDLNGIKELFSGNQTSDNSEVVHQLKNPVTNNLMEKLGINNTSAQQIAMAAIPIVLNMLNGRVKSAENNGIDINGLLNNLNSKGSGGLLNSILGMFGGGGGNSKVINTIIQQLMK